MDLQVVLKGQEYFAYTDISNPTLKVTTPYNPERMLQNIVQIKAFSLFLKKALL